MVGYTEHIRLYLIDGVIMLAADICNGILNKCQINTLLSISNRTFWCFFLHNSYSAQEFPKLGQLWKSSGGRLDGKPEVGQYGTVHALLGDQYGSVHAF